MANWLETLWACDCAYCNVATLRCHGCGARPRRALRAFVAASLEAGAVTPGPVGGPPGR